MLPGAAPRVQPVIGRVLGLRSRYPRPRTPRGRRATAEDEPPRYGRGVPPSWAAGRTHVIRGRRPEPRAPLLVDVARGERVELDLLELRGHLVAVVAHLDARL